MSTEPRKPITAPDFPRMKQRGERIVVVTAYDYPSALYADQAGVDAILVGDTVGMVVQGHSTTLPVTVDEIVYHLRAVSRAQPKGLIIGDMPFLSFQVGEDEAVRNAGRLLKEGGAQAVKVEGGARVAPLISRLTDAGIPVMGHLGLTPQSVNRFGGFRVQARQPDQAKALLDDARALQDTGAFALVLELIPAEVAREVTQALHIPTIGIGAGPHCDGEVQVFHDLLGLFEVFHPRHTKRYAEVGKTIRESLARYVEEVRRGDFPADENSFHSEALAENDTWKS